MGPRAGADRHRKQAIVAGNLPDSGFNRQIGGNLVFPV